MFMYYYPTELYHHGVLGQKWGVRRYQRSDGSLTRQGRKRFKEVANSERKQKKVRKESLKILNKDLEKTEKNRVKSKEKYKETSNEKYQDKAKQYFKHSKELKTAIKNIDSGAWKAGKEYCTTNSSIKIPFAYVGLLGPRIGIAHIPKHKVIINSSSK